MISMEKTLLFSTLLKKVKQKNWTKDEIEYIFNNNKDTMSILDLSEHFNVSKIAITKLIARYKNTFVNTN